MAVKENPMARSREEQLRNNRRLARQFVGAVALLLAFIGLLTVVGWVLAALRIVFDDTNDRRAFETQLYGVVMFDPMPFEDASQVDPAIFRQAALWSALYQTEQRDGNFDGYERDSTTGALVVPRLEIDTYLTNLLGPGFVPEDGNFSTAEFNYTYDPERQGYYVPVTSSIGQYIPSVERIFTRGGRTYVTVGYIPTLFNTNDLLLTIPDTPTKYMDYVFERGENRQLYLVALQESETQPDTPASPTSDPVTVIDPQDMVQGSLDPSLGATPEPADDDPDAPEGEGSQGDDANGEEGQEVKDEGDD